MGIAALEVGDDITILHPLLWAWEKEINPKPFGLTCTMEAMEQSIAQLVMRPDSIFLVAVEKGDVVGCLGLSAVKSHVGPEMIARETFFFARPDQRGAGLRLKNGGLKWAASRGCVGVIFSASRLASTNSDKAEGFYQAIGGVEFERSYFVRL